MSENKLKAHFNSTRSSKAGIKQEFLAQVDEPFKQDIEIVSVHEKKHGCPPTVVFTTEKDVEAMIIEAEYFLSGKFSSCAVLPSEPDPPADIV